MAFLGRGLRPLLLSYPRPELGLPIGIRHVYPLQAINSETVLLLLEVVSVVAYPADALLNVLHVQVVLRSL